MEEVTRIKDMATTVLGSIIQFAQIMFTIANSTLSDLVGMVSLSEEAPEWLKLIFNRAEKILEEIPIIGDNTLMQLMLGAGVIIVVTFAIVKFFIPIS